MENINFISGGKTGDLFHVFHVIKSICEKKNLNANLYITNDNSYGGDTFNFSIEKTYNDLLPIIKYQPYISNFEILTEPIYDAINLNFWRTSPFVSRINWSNLLKQTYSIEFPSTNWIDYKKSDEWSNKVVIHRGNRRHNQSFPWKEITEKNECVFVTCEKNEYEFFPFKKNVELKLCDSLSEMAIVINSSKFFVGNMSSPLALSHGLGVPRLCELYLIDERTYVGEEEFLKNFFYITNSYLKNNLSGVEKFISI